MNRPARAGRPIIRKRLVEIAPTIGRKVWLFIDNQVPRRERYAGVVCHDERQAFDASVCYVHPTKKGTDFFFITVTFFDHEGMLWHADVPLRQENQIRPQSREWAEWMPYQAGQAKKPATPTVEEAIAVLQAHVASLGLELVDPTEARRQPTRFAESGDKAFGTFTIDVTVPDHSGGAAPSDALPKRLTLENIEDTIVGQHYYAVPNTTVTHCTLTLRNGAKVVGHNYGAINPAAQDWELGRKEARAMAVEKVWELEGYLRIQRLWESEGFAPA